MGLNGLSKELKRQMIGLKLLGHGQPGQARNHASPLLVQGLSLIRHITPGLCVKPGSGSHRLYDLEQMI